MDAGQEQRILNELAIINRNLEEMIRLLDDSLKKKQFIKTVRSNIKNKIREYRPKGWRR